MKMSLISPQPSRLKYCGFLALLSVIAGTLTVAPAVHAVPAAPRTHTVTQPDGTTFQVQARGDEFFHWTQTTDGRVIVRDAGARWVYALPAKNGGLAPSGYVVGQPGTRDAVPAFAPQPPSSVTAKRKRRDADNAAFARRRFGHEVTGGVQGRTIPSTGIGRIPVILVTFPDRTPKYTAAQFNSMLFGTSGKTMSTFYTEISKGKFTVSAGPGGVVGWYTADHPHDYYGANNSNGDDAHAPDLVREAVTAADNAGFDFSSYDQDGDGEVDAVAVIHQGTGEEIQENDNDIWSHQWSLQYATGGSYHTQSGVTVGRYIIQPEQIWDSRMATVGVFCHEYGHVLGLPDLYDTDYSSEGLGYYSLMSGGSWMGPGTDGSVPCHMDGWCKTQLGWAALTTVTATRTGASVPLAAGNNVVYKLPISGSTTQYYLVENRQQTGFDQYLPDNGLAIYHVDDATTDDNVNEWYPGHTSSGHYHVALEQADGLFQLEKTKSNDGDGNDLYPGSTSNPQRTFSSSTTPACTAYNGKATGFAVKNISNSAATMTVDFVFGDSATTTSYSLSGTVSIYYSGAWHGLQGIAVTATRQSDKKKSTVTTTASGAYSITNLAAGSYKVTGTNTNFSYTYAPSPRQSQPLSLTTSAPTRNGINFQAHPLVRGTVYNALGTKLLSGITVRAIHIQSGSTIASATTGSNGKYVLTLNPGSYTLSAVKSSDTTFRIGADFSNPITVAQTVPTSAPTYNFHAIAVTGRVVTSGNSGISGVTVNLYAGTDTSLSHALISATTNSTGYFALNHVAAGSYIVAPKGSATYTPISRTVTVANQTVAISDFMRNSSPPKSKISGATSPIMLSSSSADIANSLVSLTFTGPLTPSAAQDTMHYTVEVNGVGIAVEAVEVRGTAVVLMLPEGALHAGDAITVQWAALSDAQGRAMSGTAQLVAR